MSYINSSSGYSAFSSMQTWQAKQKEYTAAFLEKSALASDDVLSLGLSLSQNMATFAGQQALARVNEAAAKKKATTTSNTADPYAAANAAKKVGQIINGTASVVSNASSTTDAGKTVNQIINGTSGLTSTATSTTDAAKTVNQIINGTSGLTSSGSKADMMSLTKIMYNIDSLPLPPTTDVAT